MDCVCNYAEAVRRITRVLSAQVTHAEFRVLMFIVDRTYAFNKAVEAIPSRFFTDGIPNFCCGCQLNERALRYTVSSLARKGLISVSRATTNVNKYSVNPGLMQAATQFLEDKTPKKPLRRPVSVYPTRQKPAGTPAETCRNHRQKPATVPAETCRLARVGTARDLTRDIKPEIFNEKIPNVSADAKTVVLGRINSIKENTSAVHTAKLNAGRISALANYWFEKLGEYFPDAHFAGFTIADNANFKRLVKERIDKVDPRKFIDFVCSHWVEIKRNKFPRMQNTPDYPTLSFVSRYTQSFLDALSTVEAGETLVAKDQRGERNLRVRRLGAMQHENESLRRQLARAQTRASDAVRAAEQARIDATAAAHPGLTPREIYELRRSQKNGSADLALATKPGKIDLTFQPADFDE